MCNIAFHKTEGEKKPLLKAYFPKGSGVRGCLLEKNIIQPLGLTFNTDRDFPGNFVSMRLNVYIKILK